MSHYNPYSIHELLHALYFVQIVEVRGFYKVWSNILAEAALIGYPVGLANSKSFAE